MDTSNNNLKRPISELAQSKINQEFKRLKVGDQFYDHDWNCLNENSVWSDDEEKVITRSSQEQRTKYGCDASKAMEI